MCDWRTVVHYRNRSQVFRCIAEEPEHTDNKIALRNVSSYYEMVAAVMERAIKNRTEALPLEY